MSKITENAIARAIYAKDRVKRWFKSNPERSRKIKQRPLTPRPSDMLHVSPLPKAGKVAFGCPSPPKNTAAPPPAPINKKPSKQSEKSPVAVFESGGVSVGPADSDSDSPSYSPGTQKSGSVSSASMSSGSRSSSPGSVLFVNDAPEGKRLLESSIVPKSVMVNTELLLHYLEDEGDTLAKMNAVENVASSISSSEAPPPPVAAAPRDAAGLAVSFGDRVECRNFKSGPAQIGKDTEEPVYEESLKKLEEDRLKRKAAEKS